MSQGGQTINSDHSDLDPTVRYLTIESVVDPGDKGADGEQGDAHIVQLAAT